MEILYTLLYALFIGFYNVFKKQSIKKSNEFDIPYNRQELANYLAVERTALSKELSDLQKEGKIKYNLNHFIILTK